MLNRKYRAGLGSALLVAAALTLASPLGGSLAAEPAAAAGVVSEYSPTSARYVLKRRGGSPPATAAVRVRIGTIVMAGDEITLPPKGFITLSQAEGPPRRIDGPGTFHVPSATGVGIPARLWRAFMSVAFDTEYRSTLTAVSRGGEACEPAAKGAPMVVPILRARARVVAGVRDIPLAWTGGCPPYAAALLQDQTIVTAHDNLLRSQVRFDQVTLVSGTTYAVTITDARGSRRTAEFTAVPSMPPPPPDLAGDPSALAVIARAIWLADQDEGAWRLDSFEMLRPAIRRGDPLAGRVGDVLLWQDVVRLLEPDK